MPSLACLEILLLTRPLTVTLQDIGDDGHPRYYTYGAPIFNYGFLPRTWEDPEDKNSKVKLERSSDGPVMGLLISSPPFIFFCFI